MRKPDPLKRQAITDAAKARFYRYGIQKTTMQEIASDAGMSVGTVYIYFRDKDEVIIACADAYEQEHRERIEMIEKSNDPADRRLRDYVLQRYRVAKATREGSDHSAEIARAVIRLVPNRLESESKMMLGTIGSLLAEGMKSKLFRSVELPQDVIVFAFAIAYFFPIAGNEPPTPVEEEHLAMVVDWFIDRWKRK